MQPRRFQMKLKSRLFGVSTVLALVTASLAGAEPLSDVQELGDVYELSIPKADTRATLLHYLQNVQLRSASHLNDGPDANAVSSKLMRSYRMSKEEALFPIRSAPLPRFALLSQIDNIYASAYDSIYSDIAGAYEPMMDALMKEILARQVPAELKLAGRLLGKGVAQRVLDAKSPECVLDPSETEKAPSLWSLLLMKLDFFHLMSPCEVRTLVFNELKTKVNQFRKKFPALFHKQFLAAIHEKVAHLPEFIASKFKADVDPLWGSRGSVIDSLAEGKVTLGSFAADLRTDLAEASLLIQSTDRRDRGLATALFYGVANRFLIIMGGSEASWDGQNLTYKEGQHFDKSQPKKAPVFEANPFGGWGASLGKNGPEFSPWDWSAYDPTKNALRLFPSEFLIDANGVPSPVPGQPVVQKLDDLSDILLAAVDFLTATAPDGPFGKYFVSSAQLGDILHADKPGLFPREGRLLAIGLLGGIAQNLILPNLGYIEVTNAGLRLVFHDSVTFEGRASRDISMRGISHLLMAVGSLRQEMAHDPDMPEALKNLGPQLDTVLQFGALALGKETQLPGGNFKQVLYSDHSEATIESTVSVMRGILKAYNLSSVPLLRIRLEGGYKYLISEIGLGHLKDVRPETLWELENLWEETQPLMRPNYPELDWANLEKQMNQLRETLNEQLASRHGPAILEQ